MTNIIITGCSTGIGLETAKYLKERFVKVYPTARKEIDVKNLKKMGFDNAMKLDVTKKDEITNVIDKVLKQDGKIDVWFNNAGYGQAGAIEDVSTKFLKEQFETNVFGLYECTKQVLEVMLKQNSGKIIQHSSVLGLVSLAGRGVYNSSKFAVEGISDALRIELNDTNIKVITLNTGPVTSHFKKTALKKLKENVDIENSRFKRKYTNSIKKMHQLQPFTQNGEFLAKIVHKIILLPNPKPRYYITKATYLMEFFKRVLTTSLLDKVSKKVG